MKRQIRISKQILNFSNFYKFLFLWGILLSSLSPSPLFALNSNNKNSVKSPPSLYESQLVTETPESLLKRIYEFCYATANDPSVRSPMIAQLICNCTQEEVKLSMNATYMDMYLRIKPLSKQVFDYQPENDPRLWDSRLDFPIDEVYDFVFDKAKKIGFKCIKQHDPITWKKIQNIINQNSGKNNN